MYFTECASLAERHPDLAGAVQQIDAQLAKIRADGIIRAADLASFLGTDPSQVNAVLEKLAQEKLLLAEEMVECSYCQMAVLRTEYEDMQEEGEYRCTSCDRPLTDTTVQDVTTYRPGEKWQQVPHPANGDNAPSAASSEGLPASVALDEEAWYTYDRLAEVFNLGKEALRKRLDRHRKHHLNSWKENEGRRPREPRYLYKLKDARDIIDDLRASSQRPAK